MRTYKKFSLVGSGGDEKKQEQFPRDNLFEEIIFKQRPES